MVDEGLLQALHAVSDLAAELSDVLESEGYALSVPAGRLSPIIAGASLIGPAVTIRYLPERREQGALRAENPEGRLGNMRLAAMVQRGTVVVVESPRTDVSVLGSEAAASLQAAGAMGAVVDGAVRDLAGLAQINFACWTSGRTPVTGRWRLETASLGEPVAVCGVQVRSGDIVVADDGGVVFVPADRFDELARRVIGRE